MPNRVFPQARQGADHAQPRSPPSDTALRLSKKKSSAVSSPTQNETLRPIRRSSSAVYSDPDLHKQENVTDPHNLRRDSKQHSIRKITGSVTSAVSDAAHEVTSGILRRVLGHHRDEHEEHLKFIRHHCIRENTEVKKNLKIEAHHFLIFRDDWLQKFLVHYVYSHKNPVGDEGEQYAAMNHYFLIHPMSRLRSFWDTTLLFFIFFTSIILPMEIAFFQSEEKRFPALNVFTVLIDVVFVIDVILNYNTSFYKEDNHLSVSRREIAKKYSLGWGLVDIPACLPWDAFYMWFANLDPKTPSATMTELGYASFLKTTRLLRFGKALKWLENAEFAGLWRIVRLLFSFLLLAHWAGCTLFVMSETLQDDPATSFTFQNEISDRFHQPSVFIYQYISCFHNAFLLILGEGVDFDGKGMKTYAITVMFCGAVLNSILFGQMAMLLQNLNRSGNMYQAKLDSVNEFMRHSHLSNDLKQRVHQYVEYQWKSSVGSLNRKEFLEELSYPLYKEINLMLHGHLVKNVPLFKNIDADCLVMLTCSLTNSVFLPNDFIIREGQVGLQMYFLRVGVCKVTTDRFPNHVIAEIKTGDFFGETAVLEHHVLRRMNVIAKTHCDMYVLTRQNFQHILRNFPSAGQNIRENLELKMKEDEASLPVDRLHKTVDKTIAKLRLAQRLGHFSKSKQSPRSSASDPNLKPSVNTGKEKPVILPGESSDSMNHRPENAENLMAFDEMGSPSVSRNELREIKEVVEALRVRVDKNFLALAAALRVPSRHFENFHSPSEGVPTEPVGVSVRSDV